MEISCKVTQFFLGLLLMNICTGLPINLDAPPADFHNNHFLNGLIGVLLIVCGVVCLIGCLCCERHKGFQEFHNAPVLACSSSSLDQGLTNPITNGEFTIFTPLSPFQQNNIFGIHEQKMKNEVQAETNPMLDEPFTNFPRTKLKYIRELGKGWFGRVVEGIAQGISRDQQGWTPVVVRILEASATNEQRTVFLHEVHCIYKCYKHPHILQLLGCSLDSTPFLLLQELCPLGDLKKYLLENQKTPEKILSKELPLLWCCQLSSALSHLHDNQFIHPDLAARNCQISSNLQLKLGDYGLAASLYPEDYYQGAPAVPVRWCSPESLTYTSTTLQPKKITSEANVWSLGVTMWEIYECGAQPYMHLSDDEVISHVLGSSTVRLSAPRFPLLYTNYLYRLMELCWTTFELRPSATQVNLMLTDLIQVYRNTKDVSSNTELISLQDFDNRWSTLKPNHITRTDNFQFHIDETKSDSDVDIGDLSVLNLNLDKDLKTLSPSLNNLHGSLDNLNGNEMDSWLQNLANKTGDMPFVRELSEAFNDLDNALALENVSSSDSVYLPTIAPDSSSTNNKLEFKLGPTEPMTNFIKKVDNTQNSLTDSTQRSSSESETEDETWRRKVEQGAYSEKVHQKSKSVTDLMVLTHIDYSESETETPLPSLDYRVNYKNVRYAPMQNLENMSLTFGSEGNLLSVHDKFQEELKRLQEERKDSLLFVPDNSISQYKSDEMGDTSCTATVETDISQEQTSYSINNSSPNHHNPELILQELSSPRKLQPVNQVYNVFNVSVDTTYRPDLNNILFDPTKPSCSKELTQCFQVPKLMDIIQNNDNLMCYIIARYDSENEVQSNGYKSNIAAAEQPVQFDLSLTQDQLIPNSMTHSAVSTNHAYIMEQGLDFSSDFADYTEKGEDSQSPQTNLDLTYSLETWNNFLGDTLNEPREYSNDFTSITSELPPTTEEWKTGIMDNSIVNQINNISCNDFSSIENFDFKDMEAEGNGSFNTSIEGGWFLHPQSNLELSGQLDISGSNGTENYERFNMDDDVMAAIRNELLLKLPQVQSQSSEPVHDYDESDSDERTEIHIKYNLYTTPLSPIPEESYSESNACYYICNKEEGSDTDNDDEWPAPYEERNSEVTNLEVHSVPRLESIGNANQNRHTPSQDSCGSNDTLFNLEDLTCGLNENENLKEQNSSDTGIILKCSTEETIKTDVSAKDQLQKENKVTADNCIYNSFAEKVAKNIILNHWNEHFLIKSHLNLLVNNDSYLHIHDTPKNINIELLISSNKLTLENLVSDKDLQKSYHHPICNEVISTYLEPDGIQIGNHIAGLPERCTMNGIILARNGDDSNKYLHIENNRSDINQNDTIFNWELTNTTPHCRYIDNTEDPCSFDNTTLSASVPDILNGCNLAQQKASTIEGLNPECVENGIDRSQVQFIKTFHDNNGLNYITKFLESERNDNEDNNKTISLLTDKKYINIEDIKVNMIKEIQPQYANIVYEEHLYDEVEEVEQESTDYDIYDVLTDIRFSGPGDVQLMSTSFSESADVDEQDWDSGSDTRSSSSGEFIWKEGEHEESVKALRAAPQVENRLERSQRLQDNEVDNETSDEDEDVDSPEFIPSAWDKYATPTKSALRSPEKTLERSEEKLCKPKGVWFKKQKYHCIYEYPKEPESPVTNHYESWQPETMSVPDWEVDTSPYIPTYNGSSFSQYDLMSPRRTAELYQLNANTDLSTLEDDFFISSTDRPFEAFRGLSQFFPGASDHWVDLTKNNDNITPDSGIEDTIPTNDFMHGYKVQSLKILAAMALKQSHVNVIKSNTAALGGLRHARNKLKLDLLSSPSAFSAGKAFTLEPQEEPITRIEVPTFTTFGKSRFLVQQVDTPSNEETGYKNVSFEALPYKPVKTDKAMVEVVRGEASLLDSADEDSGIESSTLERKMIAN